MVQYDLFYKHCGIMACGIYCLSHFFHHSLRVFAYNFWNKSLLKGLGEQKVPLLKRMGILLQNNSKSHQHYNDIHGFDFLG